MLNKLKNKKIWRGVMIFGFCLLIFLSQGKNALALPVGTNASGYAWGENIGWISLNCDHTSLGLPLGAANCAAQGGTDYGVLVEDVELSGFAWGENAGWISLNCSNDASCGTVDYKITNYNGVLGGYAWGENIGWIGFGDGASYQGETTWRGVLGQLSKPANLHHTNNPENPLKIIWVWDHVDYSTWDPDILTCGTPYTLQVKAKNADFDTLAGLGDETGWAESAPTFTLACNTKPIANITLVFPTDPAGDINTTFKFNGAGSSDDYTPADQLKARWDFEYDGQTPSWDIAYNGTKATFEVNNQYAARGTYTVALQVQDAALLDSDITTLNISVKGPKIAINPTTYPIGYLEDHYNFGVLESGKTKSIPMLICNLGDADLTVSSASINGDGSANFSFTPSDSSFTLGVDPDYHKCDSNLKGPIEKPAKHEVVIKFTSQLSCNPGPVTSQADFILLNNDANKTVELKGVCQESPVGEGEAAENIIYDGRIMTNPPPSFVEFLEKLQFSEKIKPR